MQINSSDNDSGHEPSEMEAVNTTPAASTRADIQRQRFRQSQAIAAQVGRARAAGGAPSDQQAARLIAEFHARGGQVTSCPPAEETTSSVEPSWGKGKSPDAE
jgi:hypothetical protein